MGIGLGLGKYGLGHFVQIIIFYYLFFESISLYTTFFSWTICMFNNEYIHIDLFIKTTFDWKNSKIIFLCMHLHRVKERERDILQFTRWARILQCFFSMLLIILFWKVDVCNSLSTTYCVRGKICFKSHIRHASGLWII